MKTTMLAPLAALAMVVTLAGCGGDDHAVDPGSTTTEPTETPTAGMPPMVTSKDDPSRTETVGLVVDDGEPRLCAGPATRSLPPQCDGIPLEGWDWDENPQHEQQGDVRWGTFGLVGVYDGETFVVEESGPGDVAGMPGASAAD